MPPLDLHIAIDDADVHRIGNRAFNHTARTACGLTLDTFNRTQHPTDHDLTCGECQQSAPKLQIRIVRHAIR